MDLPFESLVAFLAFFSIFALIAAIVAARAAEHEPVEDRLRSLSSDAPDDAFEEPAGIDSGAGVVARVVGSLSPVQASAGLKAELAAAGFHAEAAAPVYLGSKAVLLILGACLGAALSLAKELDLHQQLLLVAACGTLSSFIPNVVVRSRRERRRAEIRAHLPDAIDLLEICVSAGMGLDMAWNSVADEIRPVSPILADEMALTDLELHLGATRTEALRHMVERTGAEELASLVAVLVQSERFGTSMSNALRTFAGSMRESRSQRAEEYAERMAVKLLFPMVLFIFPVVLIVAAGPAFLTLKEIMGAS